MKLHGYLVEIDWDGSVLVARGTTADSRELVNAGTDDNRLVLDRRGGRRGRVP